MAESPRLPTEPPAAPGVAEAESDQPTRHAPVEADELLETLGDEYAYRVFEAIVEEPRTGRELVDATDASKPTVYRRLQDLEAAGLVDSTMQIASDGNHCKRFHAVVTSIKLRFDADGFGARLEQKPRPGAPDRSHATTTGTRPHADD